MSASEFFKLKPQQQINYLKKGPFLALTLQEQVDFLKKILARKNTSSKTLSCALRLIGNLKVKDGFFLQRFLTHPDNAVSSAAKSAMSKGSFVITSPLRGHDARKRDSINQRIEELQKLLQEQPDTPEEKIIAFLQDNSIVIREIIVRNLSGREGLNEKFLLAQLSHSLWHVKAAIIEILGNRRSRLLLDIIESLCAEPNVEVKLKLIGALAKLDRDQVRQHLESFTRDAHVVVRREARRFLGSI